MSQIAKILQKMGDVDGIKGTAVLTGDGIMVASTLGEEFLDDVVAGLSSFLITTTRRSLGEAGMPTAFSRFTLNSTHGKVVLVELGEAFLVVITNQFADLDRCYVDIDAAAKKLRKVSKIQV